MGSRKLCMVHEVQLATSDMRRLWSLLFLHQSFSSPVELKDDGDGLTGPQPSILGSGDKVFNKVNNFDQYQCLQKMICQFMGGAEDAVVNTVTNNFGSQSGQAAQSSFNQFQSNPGQFIQNVPNQLTQNGRPIVQAVTSQFSPSGNNFIQNGQQFLQNGQQLAQNGQQFFQTGQQFVQNGQQFVQTQFPQSNQFQTQFGLQNQNQFGQQTQFVAQNQFASQNQFVPQNQFSQQQQFSQQSSNALGDIANTIISAFAGRRKKRQTSMHGQAIRLMQSLGLSNMGAYPYVRAAIIGHANKDSPGNCDQLYIQCPSGTDQLLNYFNNHNGGLFRNALPSVTNEVGSLFPGLSALPQVAASTFGDLASSSSNNVASSSSPGSGNGFVDGVVDTLAGLIASATGRK